MGEEHNNQFIPLDTMHSIRAPQTVEEVFVQTADLKRLRWHLDKITIKEPTHDWVSIVIGAGTSLIIPCIIDSRRSIGDLIAYLIVFLALAIILILILFNRNRKIRDADPRQALAEAIQDIKTIYEKANLPYSNQDDHETSESQADHANR